MTQAPKDNLIVTNHVLEMLDRTLEHSVKRETGVKRAARHFVDS